MLTFGWVQALSKERKRKKLATVAVLDSSVGVELMQGAEGPVIEGLEGSIVRNLYSYQFVVDGMRFYFENKQRLECGPDVITVKRILRW